MRFRLATSGQQNDTFGAGFRALAGMPLMQAQAAEEAQAFGAKQRLVESQIAENMAKAAIAEEERKTLAGRGDVLTMMGATRAGMDVPSFNAALRERTQGAPAMGPALLPQPIEGVGPSGRTAAFDDAITTLYGPAMATPADKTNWEQLAKARGEYQQQDGISTALRNPGDAGRVGQAFAAGQGKPLMDAVGTSGRSMNRFTGQGGTIDAGMAVLFDQGERAEIGQRNAAATSSYASAGAARALEEQRRKEIEREVRSGDLQVVTGQDGAVTIVDKRNRTAQPVLDSQGRPVVKGSAGGGGKPLTEGQAKANLFGGRMVESGKILDELEAKGAYFPGQLKAAAEGVGGAVPIIGESLREGAGNLMNRAPTWAGGPNARQQQIEQARRDFINAVLRRESGAVISPQEFLNAEKQYFPQPGDERYPEVLAQKRRNRQIATNLMLQEVPEAQRYRGGATAAPAPAAAPGGATGSWGPKPGDVDGGYRFKGGDPADQRNWEQVR
jgi:hypothetical protein